MRFSPPSSNHRPARRVLLPLTRLFGTAVANAPAKRKAHCGSRGVWCAAFRGAIRGGAQSLEHPRMSVFEARDFDHHETVAFVDDKRSGLKAMIALHSTALGTACGGTRMYPYANGDDALTDVLRLSRGMSYKSAIADIPLGGGKAVIIGDPAKDKNEARLLAYADAVNALGGRYITARDVGITPKDLPVMARRTAHVAGYDQPGKTGGDSGPLTALGVFVGLKAAVKHKLGTDTTKGLTVAIQGLGKVGMGLAHQLH